MPSFNIEKARQAGNTDEQIAAYLIDKFPKFNSEKARAAGKSDTEIAEYLSQFDIQRQIKAPKETVPEWGRKHPNLYGGFGAGKELYERVGKPLIEAGGLVGGGLAGTPLGPIGAVGGAGLGYGIAKKTTKIIDQFLDDLQNSGVIDLKEKESVTDEMKKSMFDVIAGAEMEMGGQIVGKTLIGALDKVKAPYAKDMTPENKMYRSMARDAGIQPTPSDVTQSKALGLFESVMEKSPTASDYITKFRMKEQLKPLTEHANKLIEEGAKPEAINAVGRRIFDDVTAFLQKQGNLKGDALNKMRSEILARIGTDLPLEVVGLTGKDLLKARSIAVAERATELYLKVGEALPEGGKYQTSVLANKAKEILKIKSKLPNQDKKMMSMLKWAAKEKNVPDDVLEQLNDLPPKVRESFLLQYGDDFLVKRDWATLQEFRSDLFNLIQKEDVMYGARAFGQKGMATKEAGVYKQLRKALDADLENIAKSEGGNAWESFQAANFFYREEVKGVFGQTFIKKMASVSPEKLVDIGFKPNGVTEIKLMKRALGPQGFTNLKEGFTNKLLGVGKHDVFDPKFLRNNLIKYGDETLKEVYGATELSAFKQVAKEGLNLNKQFPGQHFLKTITRTYPDTIVDAIIGAPESKLQSHTLVKNLSIIKSAVGKKYIKEQLGAKLMEKLFAKEAISGTIKPHTLTRLVDKYGDRVLKILFEPQKVDQIKTIANIGRRLATAERIAGNPSGTGQTIIGWGTLGMIFRNPIKGTIMAVTPNIMSKIYLSDVGLKYFTDGFKTGYGTKQGVELATKLTAIINKNEGNE